MITEHFGIPASADHLVPAPRRLEAGDGTFVLDAQTRIACEGDNPALHGAAERLQTMLHQLAGLSLRIGPARPLPAAAGEIRLGIDSGAGDSGEGYALTAEPRAARIAARAPAGLFYGSLTLCDLLAARGPGAPLACCRIEDGPAFPWRGLLLDCCRHFMSVGFIKHVIDLLARLRMNRLHLHLTDNEAWRLEIASFPELTRTGALLYEEESLRGFYSRSDIREIVAHAQSQFVEVVPEIDVPGHSLAAIKAYPWLGCAGHLENGGGAPDGLLCPGQERTFDFLEKVFGAVADLFPFPFVHAGGDEVQTDRWRDCPHCRERARREGLPGTARLQGYTMRRVGRCLAGLGRTMIGWDEMLADGLPEGAVVQWWRQKQHGDWPAREAARRGHRVIASPNLQFYLNRPVVPDANFPNAVDTRKAYETRIVSDDMPVPDRDLILGGECCLWTEYLAEKDVVPMLFPRILAVSELLWSGPSPADRDFDGFWRRVERQRERWRERGAVRCLRSGWI